MVMPYPIQENIECDFCAEMIQAGDLHVIVGEREEPWHVACAAKFGIHIEGLDGTQLTM